MPQTDSHGNWGGRQVLQDRNPPPPSNNLAEKMAKLPILSAGTSVGMVFGAAKTAKDIWNATHNALQPKPTPKPSPNPHGMPATMDLSSLDWVAKLNRDIAARAAAAAAAAAAAKPPASPPLQRPHDHASNPTAFNPGSDHLVPPKPPPPPPPPPHAPRTPENQAPPAPAMPANPQPPPAKPPTPFNARAGEKLTRGQVDALASKASYLPVRPGQIGEYLLDRELSNPRHAVYYRPSRSGRGTKVVVGYRGTELNSSWSGSKGQDLYSDAHIVGGTLKYTKRAREARKSYDEAMKKYAGRISRASSRTRVTGHSLGGALSYDVAKSKGARGSAFNFGAAPNTATIAQAALCKLPKGIRPSVCDRFTRYRMRGDPLSLASRGQSASGTATQFGNMNFGMAAHDMDNFMQKSIFDTLK